MEKNCKKPCTRKSRHIDIRYLFVRERVEIKNMPIAHFSTDGILEDFFNKVLQVEIIVKFRELIIGCKNINTIQMGHH